MMLSLAHHNCIIFTRFAEYSAPQGLLCEWPQESKAFPMIGNLLEKRPTPTEPVGNAFPAPVANAVAKKIHAAPSARKLLRIAR
jgi:hypothetical protein